LRKLLKEKAMQRKKTGRRSGRISNMKKKRMGGVR